MQFLGTLSSAKTLKLWSLNEQICGKLWLGLQEKRVCDEGTAISEVFCSFSLFFM